MTQEKTMKIAVLGSGNVGAALGEALARAGHQLVFGVRGGSQEKPPVPGSTRNDVQGAVQASDVVVLAVPWGAVPDVLGQVKDWSRKVLVDCTNPLGTGLELVLGLNTSGGEQVASLAKGARVVKAFNTTGFGNMKDPKYAGRRITMLYATDDAAAAPIAEQLIRDVGFEPEFAGPLRQARYLEPFATLWISMTSRLGRDFAFTLVRR
jgi:8-hydroxy-5-deazaflavin:NADPH oxidoreductase